MNPRIEKLKDEIEKLKSKLSKGQVRLRELEKQLTDLENADIVAAVRGVEIAPDELAAFVRMFKEKQEGSIVPDIEAAVINGAGASDGKPGAKLKETDSAANMNNDKEDSDDEN